MRTEDSLDSLMGRYRQIKKIVVEPFDSFSKHYLFGPEYTGLESQLGSSSVDNTLNQAKEMAFALSLSRHLIIEMLVSDPKIKKLAKKASLVHSYDENVQQELNAVAYSLAQNKVLGGMKILDLGCGQRPAFACCARELGADVYTVDIIPSDQLEINDKQKEAREKHIQLDLRNPNAYDIIKTITGGNFDLVASASIYEQLAFSGVAGRAAPPAYLEDLALALAKYGGAFFNAEYLYDKRVILKEPGVDYEHKLMDIISCL